MKFALQRNNFINSKNIISNILRINSYSLYSFSSNIKNSEAGDKTLENSSIHETNENLDIGNLILHEATRNEDTISIQQQASLSHDPSMTSITDPISFKENFLSFSYKNNINYKVDMVKLKINSSY